MASIRALAELSRQSKRANALAQLDEVRAKYVGSEDDLGLAGEILDLFGEFTDYPREIPYGEAVSAGNVIWLLSRYAVLRRKIAEASEDDGRREALLKQMTVVLDGMIPELVRFLAEVAHNLGDAVGPIPKEDRGGPVSRLLASISLLGKKKDG